MPLPVHQVLIDMMFHKERTRNGPGFKLKNSIRSAITHAGNLFSRSVCGAVKPRKGISLFQLNVSCRD